MEGCEWKRLRSKYSPASGGITVLRGEQRHLYLHNQKCQGTLALEKKWQTQGCWFRLFTTLVGMCTIDALKMFTYLKPMIRDEGGKKVRTFVALLAKQLVDNKGEDGESEELRTLLRVRCRRRVRVCRGMKRCGSGRKAHLLGLIHTLGVQCVL